MIVDVRLNGETRQVEGGRTVADLVRMLGEDPTRDGLAVALNHEVVPRTRWATTEVHDGDAIEVVRAIQGG
jgi:sulfur carrier protein